MEREIYTVNSFFWAIITRDGQDEAIALVMEADLEIKSSL